MFGRCGQAVVEASEVAVFVDDIGQGLTAFYAGYRIAGAKAVFGLAGWGNPTRLRKALLYSLGFVLLGNGTHPRYWPATSGDDKRLAFLNPV
jgi:hypothetical protein